MNNIRQLRKDRGWTSRDLAERMGVHFTTIARLERSERVLTIDWVTKFAEVFGVTADDIIDNPFDQAISRVRQIPVIGQVAAGNWREAVRDPQDTITAPASGKNIFGLKVDGDSMDKIAPAGATVIVDPDRLDLHDGDLYVIMNGEAEATFKRYRASPARLEPVSTNPAHHPIMLGQSPFSVVGKVVGAYIAF